MATEITSDNLIPIETCFRLKAGPGAGKTYWLINHVKNVIANADLGKKGKVACITYSNIGVETIQNRLGQSDKVDVLTIHSFLYSNIVKPYFYLIAEKFGFSLEKFTGVIDDYVMDDYPTMQSAQKISNTRHIDSACWSQYLKNIRWTFNKDQLECRPYKPIYISASGKHYGLPILARTYKSIAWANGIMHYDDVLYFAYMLIEEYPWITKMLSVIYPYIFIDEYQDTNPIQSKILEKIGKKGAVIGIIGDVAQSIYSFTGASPKNFTDFSHPDLQEFEIKKNRRSVNSIIKFLNNLRVDLTQELVRNEEGNPVQFLIGLQDKAFSYVQETLQLDVLVLSYSNIETSSLRYKFLEKRGESEAVKIDDINDSNRERKKIIGYLIKAIEHARQGKFKTSFNSLTNIGFDSTKAFSVLHLLMSDKELDKTTISELAAKLKLWGIDIVVPTRGTVKKEYDSYTYGQLAQSISIEDDEGKQRTIHKAKGDEFENVLVLMGEKFDPKTFLNFNLTSNSDTNRVYYVAMSRARDRLFVNLPALSRELEQYFTDEWGIKIIHL